MNSLENRVNFIESIPAEPKSDMILARLGYRKSSTILEEKDKNMLEDSIKRGRMLCNPKGAFSRLVLTERDVDFVSTEGGIKLESKSLSELLFQSDEIVIMASTVGSEIIDVISEEIKNGNAGRGVILDSVASQTADAGLDWMMGFINKILIREGKKLTKYRYSPGYGDLPLSNQKILFEILSLYKLDIKITDTFMLIPEKTVLAIAGIERIGIDE